jgi:dipeptidyl aminopeptidase/acylaminoacyl peptidase
MLRSAVNGRQISTLEIADISRLTAEGWQAPEVFVAPGRDGKTDMWGLIQRPSSFDPKKKYPVIEYIYSGPGDQYVPKTFTPWLWNLADLAELGFIVVQLDAMTTSFRSLDFEQVCYKNLKDAGFPDRIAWIKAAAKKYPYMDISRMGIYGCSAGGQEALGALLFHGDFYKAAYAACGCHDNRMDKIWWNEQWMGWPVGPWYSENSNVDNAWRMKGKLFLINGEMDDNVDPASTLQVVSELVRHDKDFEQLYLPGHTHDLGSNYITRRVFRFFYDNCAVK